MTAVLQAEIQTGDLQSMNQVFKPLHRHVQWERKREEERDSDI